MNGSSRLLVLFEPLVHVWLVLERLVLAVARHLMREAMLPDIGMDVFPFPSGSSLE